MIFIVWVVCMILVVRIAADTMEKQEHKSDLLDK